MKEKYLVSLQEIQNALNSKGGIDTGDISWDSLKDILELVQEQEKEIEELKNIETYKLAIIDKDKYISKDKIKAKIEEFKSIRDEILKNEKELNRSMMTYDLKRNDYCESILQSLLEKENNNENNKNNRFIK